MINIKQECRTAVEFRIKDEIYNINEDFQEYEAAYKEELTQDQINKIIEIRLCSFKDYENYEYFNCDNGYIELKEGIFYLNFPDYDFKIIKLNPMTEVEQNEFNKAWNKFIEEWETIKLAVEEEQKDYDRFHSY